MASPVPVRSASGPPLAPKKSSPGPEVLLLAQTSASKVVLARFIHFSAAARVGMITAGDPQWFLEGQQEREREREQKKVAEAGLELGRSRKNRCRMLLHLPQ